MLCQRYTTIRINKPREMTAVNKNIQKTVRSFRSQSKDKTRQDTNIQIRGEKEMKQQKEMLACTINYTPRSQYWVQSFVKIKERNCRKPQESKRITEKKLEALRERRPPWPRQIITLILPTVKMLSLGCERLPTP